MKRLLVLIVLAIASALPGAGGAASNASLTHQLLDQLAGVPTRVSVSEYTGEDPWLAEDLIVCDQQEPKRFGDASPEEQAQALSGSGSCAFVEGEPAGFGYRATANSHHVHADFDKPYGQAPDGTLDVVGGEATRLEIGLDFAHNDRYYQTDLWTGLGPNGELLTWRDATYYSQDREQRVFVTAGCMTRPTPLGQPSDQCQGLRTQIDLSAPSPNGFLPLKATLDCSAEDGSCNLVLLVSSQLAGEKLFAHVIVSGRGEPKIDVSLIPGTP